MANDARGGYRQPANPAPVSGPGALSKRTDGRQPMRDIPNAAYGEQKAYQEQQQGAPLAESSPVASAPASPPVNVVPFGEPTQQPGTPVTDGANAGPGVGLASLGLQDPDQLALRDDYRTATEALPVLEFYASKPYSSPGLRQLVRRIKAGMP